MYIFVIRIIIFKVAGRQYMRLAQYILTKMSRHILSTHTLQYIADIFFSELKTVVYDEDDDETIILFK